MPGDQGSDPVPQAAVPDVVVPEAVVPDVVVPEAVVPEAVVPEAVVPEAVVPEAVVPEAVVPEAVVPEAVVPEVVGGDAPGPGGAPLSGPDLARAALASAKARATERGEAPRTPRRRPVRRADPGDARDPVTFGAAIARLVTDRGWESTTSAARVVGEWDVLVGPEIADHCRPASLLDGELVLIAQSSAWATQLRLLAAQLVRRLTAQVGPGVVTRVVVRGPAQPDWRRGPRRVQGRGPRDTYG